MKGTIKLIHEVDTCNEWIIVEGRDENGVLQVHKSFKMHEMAQAEEFFNRYVEIVTKNGFGPKKTDIKIVEIQ